MNLDSDLAVFDATLKAAQLLKLDEYDVEILVINSGHAFEKHYSRKQCLKYAVFNNLEEMIGYVKDNKPEIIFFNHHTNNYSYLLEKIGSIPQKSFIYYSAPIRYKFFDGLKYFFKNKTIHNLTKYHKEILYHFVDHEYQKKLLVKKLNININRVIVCPKPADPEVFFPIIGAEKKWDCIYPCRGGEGYWKRPELAINSCAYAQKTLVLPGAKLKKEYEFVTTFKGWQDQQKINLLFNQSKCLLVTSDYREMGPRIILEAALCNLPVVCCNDSPSAVSHVEKIGGFIAKPTVKDLKNKIDLACGVICNSRDMVSRLGYGFDLLYEKISYLIKYG